LKFSCRQIQIFGKRCADADGFDAILNAKFLLAAIAMCVELIAAFDIGLAVSS